MNAVLLSADIQRRLSAEDLRHAGAYFVPWDPRDHLAGLAIGVIARLVDEVKGFAHPLVFTGLQRDDEDIVSFGAAMRTVLRGCHRQRPSFAPARVRD